MENKVLLQVEMKEDRTRVRCNVKGAEEATNLAAALALFANKHTAFRYILEATMHSRAGKDDHEKKTNFKS